MKVSTTTKTAIIALVAAFVIYLLVVGSGEDEEQVLAYDSVEACIASGEHEETICRDEFVKAQELHEDVAPRYDRSSDCYSDFGRDRCYQRNSGGSSLWLPFMVGYMLAPRGGSAFTQPLYRTTSDPNRYYTANNTRLGAVSTNGRTSVAKSQATTRPAARTRTVARGGFGARATGRGSAGG